MAPLSKTFGAGGIAYCTLYSGVDVHEWLCATRKHCEHHISKTNKGNFTQFWSHVYLGS